MKYYISFLLISVLLIGGCSLFKSTSKPLPKPEMVHVEGGTFQMGNLWNTENTDALPVHKPQVNQPLPVGLKKPNALGLYDMSGNVFEWVGAYYQLYPKEGKDPQWDNLEERTLRIIRGGSFHQDPTIASTYWRAGMLYDGHASDVGFRCAANSK